MVKIPKGAAPKKVGKIHYDAAMKGDRELWKTTLTKRNQHNLEHRGTAWHYWDTACSRASMGISYKFERENKVTADRARLFFKRFNKDGSQRGQPVPLTLKKEDGEWRVHIASY